MLNRCSVKDDQLKKWAGCLGAKTFLWIHRQIYREKTQNIYSKGACNWWLTSLREKNDGDLLAEWDVTPYIRILKVAPRPSKLCMSHFVCFVYIQKWRIAQMLLITHWTKDRRWNMDLLRTHLLKPVSRKPNKKLKSKSVFRFYVCKIYKITQLSYGNKLPTYLYIQQSSWKGWSSFWVIVGGS